MGNVGTRSRSVRLSGIKSLQSLLLLCDSDHLFLTCNSNRNGAFNQVLPQVKVSANHESVQLCLASVLLTKHVSCEGR